MVPLDRALLSSYRLSVVTSNHDVICSGLAAICNASTWGWCRKFMLYQKLCK